MRFNYQSNTFLFFSSLLQHLPELCRPFDQLARPLDLCYGPRQFGKTTLTLRLQRKSCVIHRSKSPFIAYTETEASFWCAIGKRIQVEITSSDELQRVIITSGKRLCLFMDEMDTTFKNQSLTSNFIS